MTRAPEYKGTRINGLMFIGTEGRVMVNRGFLQTWPDHLVSHTIGPNEIHLYKSENHYGDFLDAVRGRQKPICDIEVGNSTAVVCHMGNIAYELERSLEFDQKTQSFKNDDDANQLMGRPMSGEWRV